MPRVPSPLRARRAVLAVVAAAVVPVVASCGSDRGAAATVGDESLSVSDLQDEVVELRDAYGAEAVADTGQVMRDRLQSFIIGSLIAQVAEQEGVSASGADVSALISRVEDSRDGDLSGFLEENLFTQESFEQAARTQVLLDELNEQLGGQTGVQDAVLAAQDEVPISVNRRYGRWDAEQLSVVETQGSIAVAPLEDALDTELAPE
jgi:hypothetical protein